VSTAAEAPRKRRFRLSLAQIGTLVGLISAIVTLVLVFRPWWKPQDVGKAAISDIVVRQPYTFRRYLQRVRIAPQDLTRAYLARRGVLVAFHYEITGLRGKNLPLRWELSDNETNELIAEKNAFGLVPSTNDEGGDWGVWVPMPKRGREYYITVTIYQAKGPPYELKHYASPPFKVRPTTP